MIPLFNHVWQSSLFAAMAGLLTLAFRNSRARTRYWLWLAASLKFLVPFSLLIGIGSHIEWRSVQAGPQPEWPFAVQQVSEPFGGPLVHGATPAAATSALPEFLLAIWAAGFLAVLFRWWLRSRGLRVALRAASPLETPAPIEVRSSAANLEPGVFGIWRPVLLLPEGITERLTARQLEAIFAHELCHVRRRDNLAAAVHMLVEAIFWFHPLVWWLGARLVDERERACDEAVLQSGGEPQAYAEGILNVCKFCLESPLDCAAGVTGSNLKSRIEAIMTRRIGRELTLSGRLLLACAGALALAGPVGMGLLNAPPLRAQTPAATEAPLTYEVASIKPSDPASHNMMFQFAPGGRLVAKGVTVKSLIAFAYGVMEFQVSGGPGWASSARYDVTAKPEASSETAAPTDDQFERMQREQRQRMQALLADRFQLKTGHGTKELPIYALTIQKNGPKLKESKQAEGKHFRGVRMGGPGRLSGEGMPMRLFAEVLSRQLGRPVIDQTGLTGKYDVNLEWTPDRSQADGLKGGPPGGPGGPPPVDPNGPSIFTAIQEQLGLKLDAQKGPVAMVTIDRLERPSEN